MIPAENTALRSMVARVCNRVAEIAVPSQNLVTYQETELSQGGGGFQEGTWRYPSVGTQSKGEGWSEMMHQGERPEQDADFYTDPNANIETEAVAPWGEQWSRPRGQGIIDDESLQRATSPEGCGPNCEQIQRFLIQVGKPPVEEGSQESEFRYDRAQYLS